MLFIFGNKTQHELITEIEATCPQCGRNPCGLYWAAKRATVYFVSVATMRRNYVVGCEPCDTFWEIDQALAKRLHGHLQGDAAARPGKHAQGRSEPAAMTEAESRDALIEAARGGHLEKVKTLLKRGVDVNARDTLGETALLAAAEENHLKTVKLLLGKGADINAKHATFGWTPLIKAAEEGHLHLARTLLDHKADINARDRNGYTALLRAVERGRAEVVQLLLERGADVQAASNTGFTPLLQAFVKGHTRIEEMLRRAGAK